MSETKIPDDLREEYEEMKACALRDNAEHYKERCINLIERLAAAEAREREAVAEHGKTLLLLNKAAFETIPALEAREKELREEIERLTGLLDARVSDVASCMRQSGKLKDENALLRTQLARIQEPVTYKERDQLNKATDYSMGDTLEQRIIPLVDAIIAARAAKGGE